MENIQIKRFGSEEDVQACIEPENGSWQLLIDKDGFPRLYVRTRIEEDDGSILHGLLAIDDVLPEGMTVPEIMQSSFGGSLSPEDEERLLAEGFESRAPCPYQG